MFGWRSARGRAILAAAVFMLLLACVAVVAVWRAEDDRERHHSLDHRSQVVAATDNARAQALHGATSITAAVFAQDPTPYIESWIQNSASRDEELEKARWGLIALGDNDSVATLDTYIEESARTEKQIDAIIDFAATADVSTRVAVAQRYYAELWAGGETQLASLDQLARSQQAKLASERAAADRAAGITLALLIAFGAAAFVTGAAALIMLVVSVLRPLTSLQASVRAITSGHLDARAKVAGPEEVASLAHDFNEMVSARKRVEEALRQQKDFAEGLIASMQDGFTVLDSRGVHVDVNPAFCHMTGFSREELFGVGPPHPYWPPEAYEEIESAFQKTLRGQFDNFELTFMRKNGERFPVIVSPS